MTTTTTADAAATSTTKSATAKGEMMEITFEDGSGNDAHKPTTTATAAATTTTTKPKPTLTSKPSHRRVVSNEVTNHKQEAQQVLQGLQAKEQQTVLEAETTTTTSKPFVVAKKTTIDATTPSEVRHSVITGPAPLVEPTLIETTEYLKALHQQHADDDHLTATANHNNNKNEPQQPLADTDILLDVEPELHGADAMDRVVLVTQVLKEAAVAPHLDKEDTATLATDADLEHQSPPHLDDDDDNNTTPATKPKQQQQQHPKRHRFATVPGLNTTRALQQAYRAGATEWSQLRDFFQPKRTHFVRLVCLYVALCVVPLTGTAALLFYLGENPPTGRCLEDEDPDSSACTNATASASWWLLFLGVRQVLTWLLARATDLFLIDFMILQHSYIVRLMGPQLSLIVVQSKGWPSILFWWAIWDFMLLYGENDFSDHWLYRQDTIKLFTFENPSGNITTTSVYKQVLTSAVVVALATCLKRHWTGLHLGGRLCGRYHDKLKELTKEILLISELALWARLKNQRRKEKAHKAVERYMTVETSTADNAPNPSKESIQNSHNTSPNVSQLHGSESERPEFTDFTGVIEPWQDPNDSPNGQTTVSGNEIIEFRQAYAVVTKPYFFSSAFGPVGSRDECLKSAELLYRRLLKLMDDDTDDLLDLQKLIMWMYKGCHRPEEKENAAALTEILVPDVDDKISLVGFVTAIDAVYRRLRLLESSVKNHSHVDQSYEKVINIIFFFFLFCVVLAILGTNPIIFIGSISALVVSFAFMIGPGVSQQFEGILMVLVRQPYDIGDRIAIDTVDRAPSTDGSVHWMVEKIDLVTTTARLTATGEVATFSNGTLARTRLINMNRSPDAVVYVPVRFSTDVPYSTIMVFREAIQKFVDDRPQEWASLNGFRATRVESQLNYVEYTIVLGHRNKWQDVLPILVSKAAVASFAVEVQEQLGCHYKAPSMGVEISMAETTTSKNQLRSEPSAESLLDVAKQFPAKKDD